MSVEHIDALQLRSAFITGAKSLEARKEWINELNVFPVPDGDTGTNMTMTIMSAANAAAGLTEVTIASVCKAVSSGSLRGARGNSGVILSQLFRGAAKILQEAKEVDVFTLAAAFDKAADTAYKAVMKPKEGTILTVARGMSDKALELSETTTDVLDFLEQVIDRGEEVLQKTPELLPVLKQAGVVDSGGQGLMVVMRGFLEGLKGNVIELGDVILSSSHGKEVAAAKEDLDTSDIKFGYCTEFIINLQKEFPQGQEQAFKRFLSEIGDSIVCVADDEVVKVHVHTNDPGLAIQKALTFGELTNLKIDNMRQEHRERVIKNVDAILEKQKQESSQPEKEYGILAVCAGAGLAEIFKGIGADAVIEGGQTMNPSTEDILEAVERVNAARIFVLPNNKNIILAAQQAAKLSREKELIVVPTKNIPQGITAMINFMPDKTPQENLESMTAEMEKVKTASITYAVRDTIIEGVEIHEKDIMALGDQGVLAAGPVLEEIVLAALRKMTDADSELVSLYYGQDVTAEQAQALLAKARQALPQVEFELQEGGQPVYYYFISVE